MSVTVVIPTTGKESAIKAVNSVKNQTFKEVTPLLVYDGPSWNKLDIECDSMTLPYNTGANGFYGHRIYASISALLNTDYVMFLDEDNWFEPDHVESLMSIINKNNYLWAYSLRKIYDKGEYVCDDNCESLGQWPVYVNQSNFLVDTSCYCIRRDVGIKLGGSIYGKWGADRQFLSVLKQYAPNFGSTKKHTVCYQLGGNEGSVTKDFFLTGNAMMAEKYPDGMPWHSTSSDIIPDDKIVLEI